MLALLIPLIFSQVKALSCSSTLTCDAPKLYHNTGAGTTLAQIEVSAMSSTAVLTGLFDQFDASGTNIDKCGTLADQEITADGLES